LKIDLDLIDRAQFMIHQHVLDGEQLWLIQPQHIGCKWTQDNKILRSSLWNNDGELVSAGFPKFVNWGENLEHFPVPKSLNKTTIVEKVDGSLLIVSKYKGKHIIRTRGTSNVEDLENAHEIEVFKQALLYKIDLIYNSIKDWGKKSWLFEWVSPTRKIILNYGEQPDWILVGVVEHLDYTLWSQERLDEVAKALEFKRPSTYQFSSVEALMTDVETWKGKEGVCVYSKDGQAIHKCKSLWYLSLHRMKEALSSFDKVVDVWFAQGEPEYRTFEANITSQFDWELWNQCRGDASRICDGSKEVAKIIQGMNTFVTSRLAHLPTRKEQALEVIKAYGNTNRASFVFKLLDGKGLDSEDRKKLLYQVLKN